MNVTLMVITDGRWDYLEQTLASAADMLRCDWSQLLLVDDSGLTDHPTIEGFDVVRNPVRRGLAGAIQTGWDHIDGTADYVFHLEDDFTFPHPVDVAGMIDLLERYEDLAQVALLRQPWSPEEQQAGGIFQAFPERFVQLDEYVAQKYLFTFNPCVYPAYLPRWIPAGLEQGVTDDLLSGGYHFGFLGHLNDPPRCTHIGARRSAGHKW